VKIKFFSVVLLIFLSPLAFGNTLDFECSFKSHLPYDVLKKIEKDPDSHAAGNINAFSTKKKWWQFWIADSKLMFSVDIENKSAIVSTDQDYPIDAIPYFLIPRHSAAVSASIITIDGYDNDIDEKPVRATQYTINRINGSIYGEIFVTQEGQYQPILKKGDLRYFLFGKCRPIKRAF
jgi:hypothetical protein